MVMKNDSGVGNVLDEIRSTLESLKTLQNSAGIERAAHAAQQSSSATAVPFTESAATVPPTDSQIKPLHEPAAAMAPLEADPAEPSMAVTAPIPPELDTPDFEDENQPEQVPSASLGMAGAIDEDFREEATEETVAEESCGVNGAVSSMVRSRIDPNASIMIVDDEPLNIMTFRQHLKMEGYQNFITTSDAREALPLMRKEMPDVLLLDIRMPEINGLDILRVVCLDPVLQHIPVLILTAASDPATRKEALDMGANDFLSKPIDPSELLPRVRNAIVVKKHFDMANSEAQRLEQMVRRRTQQLEATRQQLILSLARAAEHRDNETGNHVIRVGRYAAIIAEQMGYPKSRLEMLEQAAQLHDVGKIGIPDSILFKPGKLDFDQYELMKKHCALGKQIIEPISEREWNVLKTHTRIGEGLLHVRSSPLLMLAARIAQTHHERWDGTGYPLGLKGNDIPLEGRVVAVADVFDALSSNRPYKDPFPREKCFAILEEGRGTHFDPAVLDAFFTMAEQIVDTQLALMDEEDQLTGPEHVKDESEEEQTYEKRQD